MPITTLVTPSESPTSVGRPHLRSPRIVAAAILVAGAIVSAVGWWMLGGDTDAPRRPTPGATGTLIGDLAGREASDPNPPELGPEMVDEIQSTLRNAAVAMETWATDNGGAYVGVTFEDLYDLGLRVNPEVTLSFEAAVDEYCLLADHSMLPSDSDWRLATYDSSVGEIRTTDTCG